MDGITGKDADREQRWQGLLVAATHGLAGLAGLEEN